MAQWNYKHERTKKQAKRDRRMKNTDTSVIQQATVPPVGGTNPDSPTPARYQGHQGRPAYDYTTKYNTGYVAVPTPTDTKDTSKLSIVLMRQSVLNAISAICQPVAGASEFQVHYRALVVRVKNETNELIINVPTAFFNFKQTVAHASVDYHLDDIDNAAEVVKPISDRIIQEIFAEMPILVALKELYGDSAEVTFSEVNSGSIHRHPGRFGFSGTDYTKTPSNPGVIYREAEATDKVHTDSVIYLGARTEIYTTESRILNIAPKDRGVEGTYCQIPTTTFLLNDIAGVDSAEVANTMADFLGGLENELKDSSGDYYITNAMGAITGYALVTEVINSFKDAKFQQDISNVLASHITSRFTTYSYAGGHYPTAKAGNGGKKQVGGRDLWDDGWNYVYDDDDYEIGGYWMHGQYVPPVQKAKVAVKSIDDKPSINEGTALVSYQHLKNPYPASSPFHKEWEERHKV